MSLSRADGASEPDQGRADAKPPKSGCAARRATSNASTIARYRPLCAVRSLGRTNAPTGQARGATNEHGTRARALGPSGPTMIIPSYVVTLWALLFVSCGPTAAQSVAVFVANCENPIALRAALSAKLRLFRRFPWNRCSRLPSVRSFIAGQPRIREQLGHRADARLIAYSMAQARWRGQ
jgi:hypothetical protein